MKITIQHPAMVRFEAQPGDVIEIHRESPELAQLLRARRLDGEAVATADEDTSLHQSLERASVRHGRARESRAAVS